MANIDELIAQCEFDSVGSCSVAQLRLRPKVRDMCASGRCHMYGHNWACPPHCGELEDFERAMKAHETCYILQTVAQLEDEFDIEGMQEAERLHKQRFFRLADSVRGSGIDAMLLSAGACTVCPKCTCPEEPCRFPEKRFSSMEAAGLVVSEACTSAGIPYNHGRNTMAYSSCMLV